MRMIGKNISKYVGVDFSQRNADGSALLRGDGYGNEYIQTEGYKGEKLEIDFDS